MLVFDVIENKSILINKELILKDDYFDILSDINNPSFFSVSFKPKGLEITAGNHIGVIPINKSVALNIIPKLEIKNFFYLLRVANRELKTLSNFSRLYSQSNDYTNLMDLFTSTFIKSLEIIEQEGIYRNYTKKERNNSTPKGKLLFKEHLVQNVFRNIHYKVPHTFQELDRDVLPNQLIKYTIEYLIQYYRLLEGTKIQFLKRLEYYRQMFVRVSYKKIIRDMKQSEFNYMIKSIPKIRSYYIGCLEVCFLIIKKASFHFEERKIFKKQSLPSVYINMEDIFEKYLLNSLNNINNSQQIKIYKGKRSLFEDVKTPTIEPDIVIENNSEVSCIADAKYKNSLPTRDDIFQMISYLSSYHCNVGVFILPKENNQKVDYKGNVQGKHIYIYRIDLNHVDIEDTKREENELYKFLKMSFKDKQAYYCQYNPSRV